MFMNKPGGVIQFSFGAKLRPADQDDHATPESSSFRSKARNSQ